MNGVIFGRRINCVLFFTKEIDPLTASLCKSDFVCVCVENRQCEKEKEEVATTKPATTQRHSIALTVEFNLYISFDKNICAFLE